MDAFQTDRLSSLRSKEHLDLLDEIDTLRRSGISAHVSLPQIAVCGDQSSGKSSCLEAISGIPFPRKDTLCTRFATELILRKSPNESVLVRIVPHQFRTGIERSELARFEHTLKSFDEIPALIESAKIAMGLDQLGSGFSSDILRIEVSGPTRPHLTVVDLPGLIHGKNDDRDGDDVEEVVSDLVDSYMRRPRTIILAVVSALNDLALQAVLKRAKLVDPYGKRTMGLITKPDTLPEGSDSEKDYVKLAQNKTTHLRLGWHVLRNRDFKNRDASSHERDRLEEEFFSQGVWGTVSHNSLGVTKLRGRLSQILLDHIRSELPTLIGEIKEILEETQEALAKLGDHRNTTEQQRQYLLKHSQSFTTICKASSDGIYDGTFFGDLSDDKSRARRFRAVVQNLNLDFAEKVRIHGYHIVLQGNGLGGKSKEAIKWVREILTSSRGRELPGTFSPMLVGDLFRVQSKPWEKISKDHLTDMWERSKKHIEDILGSLLTTEVWTALLLHWVDPIMEGLLKTANNELDRLLLDRQRHAITYNHYFTENIQKSYNDRNNKKLLKVLEGLFPIGINHNGETCRVGPEDLSRISVIMTETIQDMDTHASIELLNHLEAFYKVAMKTFVDNVAIQVIEASILDGLANVFDPTSVFNMPVDLVSSIAAEPQENQSQREAIKCKLDVLKEGMKICKRHAIRHGIDKDDTPASPLPSPSLPSIPEAFEEPIEAPIEEPSQEPVAVPVSTSDFDFAPQPVADDWSNWGLGMRSGPSKKKKGRKMSPPPLLHNEF